MIDRFFGEHRFLSNFFPSVVMLDGKLYPTVEHAYVAAKTFDLTLRDEIRHCPTPGQAKRVGRGLVLREDWEEIKVIVMENLLRQKFSHADLRQRLVATGDQILIEGNTWGDKFWGVCRGEGRNMLGQLLMKIRKECGG